MSARNPLTVPPHDLDAERAVIGALLVSEDALVRVGEILTETDFYSESYRVVYRAAMRLFSRGESVDQLMLSEELKAMEEFEKIGGRQLLFNLVESVPTAANAHRYAEIVRQKSLLRSVIDAASTIQQEAFSDPEDVLDMLDRAEQMLYDVSGEGAGTNERHGLLPLSELTSPALEEIQAFYEAGGTITGTPSGFNDLDQMTTGFHPGDFIVVAGRPSMGKTAFSLNVSQYVAKQGETVAIFSLEMDKRQLVNRMLAQEASIPITSLRTGRIEDDKWGVLVRASADVGELPIFIDDSASSTVGSMRGKLRRLDARLRHREKKIGLVVVDYIQLMTSAIHTGTRKSENRQQEISDISRGLKVMARDLEVPVLGLSQLSRGVEQRADKHPMLSDLRECLPVDEWVSTPKGPVKLGSRPERVSTLAQIGMISSRSEYIPKRYNGVYEVRSQYGTFRATARHMVLTGTGYKQVRDLVPGRDVVAAPKHVTHAARGTMPHGRLLGWMLGNGGLSGTPSLIYRTELDSEVRREVEVLGVQVKPRKMQKSMNVIDAYFSNGVETGSLANPFMVWLRKLSLEGKVALDKAVPEEYMGSSDSTHADLILGLWESDGTVTGGVAKYTSVSETLARQVSWLLLTLGIRSTVTKSVNEYEGLYEVRASSADNEKMREILARSPEDRFGQLSDPDPDYIDPAPAIYVELAAEILGRTGRRWQKRPGGAYKAASKSEMKIAIEGESRLSSIAHSPYMKLENVGWGRLHSVQKLNGEVRVADLSVPGSHNFVTNGVIVHNSGAIEQDADLVLSLYRDEYYNPQSEDKGVAEVIIGKARNGPTGTIRLAWLEKYARFAALARDHTEPGPVSYG